MAGTVNTAVDYNKLEESKGLINDMLTDMMDTSSEINTIMNSISELDNIQLPASAGGRMPSNYVPEHNHDGCFNELPDELEKIKNSLNGGNLYNKANNLFETIRSAIDCFTDSEGKAINEESWESFVSGLSSTYKPESIKEGDNIDWIFHYTAENFEKNMTEEERALFEATKAEIASLATTTAASIYCPDEYQSQIEWTEALIKKYQAQGYTEDEAKKLAEYERYLVQLDETGAEKVNGYTSEALEEKWEAITEDEYPNGEEEINEIAGEEINEIAGEEIPDGSLNGTGGSTGSNTTLQQRVGTDTTPNEGSTTSNSNNQENTGNNNTNTENNNTNTDNNSNNNNNTENNNSNTDSNTNHNQENNNNSNTDSNTNHNQENNTNTDNNTNTNPENNNSNIGNNTNNNTNTNNNNNNVNAGSNGNRPNTGNNNYRPGNNTGTGSGNNQSSGMGMPPVEDNSNASTTTPSAPDSDAGIIDNTGETLDVISIDKDGGKASASTSSNDGGSVIPTILGVGVAGAAAVTGAKILHDKKNKENEYSYEEDGAENDNSFANLDSYSEDDTIDQTIPMSPGKYKAGSANNLVLEDAPSDIKIDESIADIPNQKEELE